jgi:hypothetical protein
MAEMGKRFIRKDFPVLYRFAGMHTKQRKMRCPERSDQTAILSEEYLMPAGYRKKRESVLMEFTWRFSYP